jgi:hypothetical protein
MGHAEYMEPSQFPLRTLNGYLHRERVSDSSDNLIADLTAPGVVVVYYLSDGSTARARYLAGTIEDVEATLSVARRTGKSIQVDSADSGTDGTMEIYLVPQQVVMVKIERAGDPLGPLLDLTFSMSNGHEPGEASTNPLRRATSSRKGESALRV